MSTETTCVCTSPARPARTPARLDLGHAMPAKPSLHRQPAGQRRPVVRRWFQT